MVLPVRNSHSELAVFPPNTLETAMPRRADGMNSSRKGVTSRLVSKSPSTRRSAMDSIMTTTTFGLSPAAALSSAA